MTNPLPQWPPTAAAPNPDARRLPAAVKARLARFYAEHELGEDFIARLPGLYLPLAAWIARRAAADPAGKPLLLALNGSQGSGKSTLAALLRILLQGVLRQRVAVVSLDDFYLTRAERHRLAQTRHPLFITRGPPGTHDTQLAADTLAALAQTEPGKPVRLPRFDKGADDRAPVSAWPTVDTPLDIVIFEGWCVGAAAQSPARLARPINALEAQEDPAGLWRGAVNTHLARDYHALFARIDLLAMLKAPSMDQVHAWRALQERKLRQRHPTAPAHSMDSRALRRFIMHYERLTRHQLQEMPPRADVVLALDTSHQVAQVVVRAADGRQE